MSRNLGGNDRHDARQLSPQFTLSRDQRFCKAPIQVCLERLDLAIWWIFDIREKGVDVDVSVVEKLFPKSGYIP